MNSMVKPTEAQIRDEALRLATALGGGVALHGSRLAESVDCKFPGMSESDFVNVSSVCFLIADEIRTDALRKMWS